MFDNIFTFMFRLMPELFNQRGEIILPNPPETFSKEYVHELREENKKTRLKVDEISAQITLLNTDLNKQKSLVDIANKLNASGIKANATEVYQDGKTTEQALADFAQKNPKLFNTGIVKIGGGIEVGAEVLAGLTKPISEIKKDPVLRGVITNLYKKYLSDDRARGRSLKT